MPAILHPTVAKFTKQRAVSGSRVKSPAPSQKKPASFRIDCTTLKSTGRYSFSEWAILRMEALRDHYS